MLYEQLSILNRNYAEGCHPLNLRVYFEGIPFCEEFDLKFPLNLPKPNIQDQKASGDIIFQIPHFDDLLSKALVLHDYVIQRNHEFTIIKLGLNKGFHVMRLPCIRHQQHHLQSRMLRFPLDFRPRIPPGGSQLKMPVDTSGLPGYGKHGSGPRPVV